MYAYFILLLVVDYKKKTNQDSQKMHFWLYGLNKVECKGNSLRYQNRMVWSSFELSLLYPAIK